MNQGKLIVEFRNCVVEFNFHQRYVENENPYLNQQMYDITFDYKLKGRYGHADLGAQGSSAVDALKSISRIERKSPGNYYLFLPTTLMDLDSNNFKNWFGPNNIAGKSVNDAIKNFIMNNSINLKIKPAGLVGGDDFNKYWDTIPTINKQGDTAIDVKAKPIQRRTNEKPKLSRVDRWLKRLGF